MLLLSSVLRAPSSTADSASTMPRAGCRIACGRLRTAASTARGVPCAAQKRQRLRKLVSALASLHCIILSAPSYHVAVGLERLPHDSVYSADQPARQARVRPLQTCMSGPETTLNKTELSAFCYGRSTPQQTRTFVDGGGLVYKDSRDCHRLWPRRRRDGVGRRDQEHLYRARTPVCFHANLAGRSVFLGQPVDEHVRACRP